MIQLFDKLSNPFDSGFRIKRIEIQDKEGTWYYHNEYEITYIESGKGIRGIGNSEERFGQGDIVFLGRNITHRWLFDKSKSAVNSAIVIQFQDSFLSDRLLEKPEMISIFQLIGKSKSGISFDEETRNDVRERMNAMLNMDAFDQTITLLKILKVMSLSKEVKLLSTPVFNMNDVKLSDSRITYACNYVNANYNKKIKLETVANEINMSVSAFCRYFKRKTNRTFYSFVTESRIAHACLLLKERNMSVAEVCYESGYDNISIFNRHFKSLTQTTPLQYKQMFNKGNR